MPHYGYQPHPFDGVTPNKSDRTVWPPNENDHSTAHKGEAPKKPARPKADSSGWSYGMTTGA